MFITNNAAFRFARKHLPFLDKPEPRGMVEVLVHVAEAFRAQKALGQAMRHEDAQRLIDLCAPHARRIEQDTNNPLSHTLHNVHSALKGYQSYTGKTFYDDGHSYSGPEKDRKQLEAYCHMLDDDGLAKDVARACTGRALELSADELFFSNEYRHNKYPASTNAPRNAMDTLAQIAASLRAQVTLKRPLRREDARRLYQMCQPQIMEGAGIPDDVPDSLSLFVMSSIALQSYLPFCKDKITLESHGASHRIILSNSAKDCAQFQAFNTVLNTLRDDLVELHRKHLVEVHPEHFTMPDYAVKGMQLVFPSSIQLPENFFAKP